MNTISEAVMQAVSNGQIINGQCAVSSGGFFDAIPDDHSVHCIDGGECFTFADGSSAGLFYTGAEGPKHFTAAWLA